MLKHLALLITAFACLQASTALGLWNYERPLENTSELLACWSNETVSYTVGKNGAAFRHTEGTWTDISDDALKDTTLMAVHRTPSGTIYAAGNRPGAPRFDTNGDGKVTSSDKESLYGVIFRYTGSAWEELSTGYTPESPFFATSFASIWADDDQAVYFAGGKQISSNEEAPLGILLSYDGAGFAPIVSATNQLPTINGVWGTSTHAYLACSSGAIFELNRKSETLTLMKSGGYAVNYRCIRSDSNGTLYSVAESSSTEGYIFRNDATYGWQFMGIDGENAPPLYAIQQYGNLLVASGSFGKAYYLDLEKKQKVWKEMLVGTQSHIYSLSVAGSDLLGATSGGELYRMTEMSPTTAYILADPPTGIGTWVDDTLTHEFTLYDFSLGDIWKREWHFNNGNHHDPMPSYGVLYSYTPQGASTALYITGEGGAESNRELRIADCDCTPHVGEVTDDTITLHIDSGHTTQDTIKSLLENSSAVSEVYARHGESAWVVSSKEYDRVYLTGGREDEDLYINEATSGDSYYLATHRFKDEDTWEPTLTVYRENVTFLDGAIKIMGRRNETSGPTIRVEDAGVTDRSTAAEGDLGNIIHITSVPGSRGNMEIELYDDPGASKISSTFSGYKLFITIRGGVTTIGDLITHLKEQELIAEAALPEPNNTTFTLTSAWDIDTMGKKTTLEGGKNHAVPTYDEASDTITITIDSGISTSRDIAEAIFNTRVDPKDDTSDRLVKALELTTPEMVWNTEDNTNKTTLPGITTETAKTTVRIIDQDALNFTHTPSEAQFEATVAFHDASDPSLEIAKWEWHVFREVSDGFDTKATAQSDSGTAEATVSDLGKYDIGMKVTLKDGSTLHTVKEEALNIKGETSGNGCFIGAACH